MLVTTDEWGTRIYPFAEGELTGAEAHVSILKYGEPGEVVINAHLNHLTAEKWAKLKAAVDHAFALVEQGGVG